MLILDAHLDLAMNAMEWNRDLTRPLDEIRRREAHLTDKPDRGHATVSFPEMRRAGIGICVATQIARYVEETHPLPGWNSPSQAWAQTQAQLSWYRAMEEAGEVVQIRDRGALQKQLELLKNPPAHAPIGYILSLEGADSMITPAYAERSYAQGLRAIGPAHYGPGRYAQGTDWSGGLTPRGRELLVEMQRLGIILDATHLCDESFWEALKVFQGPIWASHHNSRALVPHNRQMSDEMIRALVERGAVIGIVFDAWMMIPGWIRGESTPENRDLKLEKIVDHVDHYCQVIGNARHVGIGSDLDGAFGFEQTPQDLKTIHDLTRLPRLFQQRGYSPEDIEGIMSGNFLRFLQKNLP